MTQTVSHVVRAGVVSSLCVWALLASGCDAKRGSEAGSTPATAASSSEANSARNANETPIDVVDDAGNTVRLAKPAMRIISLIPSSTETLIAVGATSHIVGRTRYDVADEVASLPSVGGSVDPSIEAITALQPDLVIGWESDKRQQIRSKLQALGVPMFLLRTQDTTDVFRAIRNLARLTGHDTAALRVAGELRADLDSVRKSVAQLKAPSVFYVVFNDPPMTAGSQTFIGQLISLAGGRSIFADLSANWPNVAMEEIVRRDPDIIVVPVGEFKGNSVDRFRSMQGWRTLRAVREGRVMTVPSNLLSRPSPNIGRAAHALRAALFREFRDDPVVKSLAYGAESRGK